MTAHQINSATLDSVRGYLEGLAVILDDLHASETGHGSTTPLAERLQELPEGIGEWAPLRYETGVGMGWHYVAENVRATLAALPPRVD